MLVTRRLISLLCLALTAPVAFGKSLEDCRSIKDNAARLGCYDALTNDPAIPQTGIASDTSAPPPAAATANPNPPPENDVLGKSWELGPGRQGHILRILPYQPVYVLPWFHTSHANRAPSSPSPGHSTTTDQTNSEAKFQISLKTKLAEDLLGDNGDLWFGYTQTSRWQVYDSAASRPFRETNYEPEAMFVWRTDYTLGNWRGRYVSLGVDHQSNGRSLPLSRSWNRAIAAIGLENDDWTLTLRPWWRIPESPSQDDNPDISSYLGRADLHLVRHWDKRQFSVLLRHNLESGGNSRGALQLDYAFPIAGDLRAHLQWFSGYGESMIDYNHRANYFGIGVSLIEW